MKRIRRSKTRNYTIFIVLAAVMLTAGYAMFAQPLAQRLATILPDNSRFGLWHGGSESGADVNDGNGSYADTGTNSRIDYGKKGYSNNQVSTKQWDISFVEGKTVGTTGGAVEKYPTSFNNMFATFYVFFTEPGDSITYEYTIKNKGVLDAQLNSYDIITTNNSKVIKFKTEGINVGDVLKVGQTKKIRVTASYDSKVTSESKINTDSIMIVVRYVQK